MRAFDQRFADVYNDIERFPSLEHVAQEMEVSVKTVRNRAGEMRALAAEGMDVPQLISRVGTGRTAGKPQPVTESDQPEVEFTDRTLVSYRHYDPLPHATRRFIITSAQDESNVHEPFLERLQEYAAWLGNTEILVAGFTYNKSVWNEDQAKRTSKRDEPHFYRESIREYLVHDQVEIGDTLIFCGEMNTLPTASNPLSGFETYTRDKWGVFPHAKQRMQTVATAKFKPTKHLFTTGAITLPNYVQKKAGIVAEFHHVIGAVIVELMPDGTTFVRHISTDLEGDGTFQDLDIIVDSKGITTGNRIEALNPGDIHHEKLDPEVALTTFGYDTETQQIITHLNLMDQLRPKHVFMHDLSDFAPRNHHNIKDHHFLFKTHRKGVDNVAEALMGCSAFLSAVRRDFTKIVVIQSNHDNALLTWLRTADYRTDQVNALFFLECQTAYYQAIAEGIEDPPIFEDVLRGFTADRLDGVKFVAEDDSYMICGNIECAMHGHLGANGARGNPRQFTKMGSKSNTGHTHSPWMGDGAAVAGVSGGLDMGYNRGLSSWDHSHIVTYPNGRRTIITMRNGRWYAPRG